MRSRYGIEPRFVPLHATMRAAAERRARGRSELAPGRLARDGECIEGSSGQFWIAFNPHDVPTETSRGQRLDPRTVFVERNGRAAAMLCEDGGMLMSGKGWTLEELSAALAAMHLST